MLCNNSLALFLRSKVARNLGHGATVSIDDWSDPGVLPLLSWKATGTLMVPQKAGKARFYNAAARVAEDIVLSENPGAVLVHGPIENDGTAASLNFNSHRRAHDEAGSGRHSWRDRPCKAA